MQLLLSQKNNTFDMIVANDLTPALFIYREIESKDIGRGYEVIDTTINYNNSAFHFQIRTNVGKFYVSYSPGSDTMYHNVATNSWNNTLIAFSEWLNYLKREINSTDKWDEFLTLSSNISYAQDNGKFTKFTCDEYETIKTNTEIAKGKIKLLPLEQSQITEINSKLDYLCDKAKHFNKIDWKNLFIGTLLQTIIQLSVPPDIMQKIWHCIGESYTLIKLIIAK